MTDSNKFFKFIWRVNGLIIFAVSLCCAVLAMIAFLGVFNSITDERTVIRTVNVENTEKIEEELEFGYVFGVNNTPYLTIALNSGQKYAQAYFSKASSSTRNYLFLNTDTNQKNWLLKHNHFLVTKKDILTYKKQGQDKILSVGYLFQIVKSDTNLDQRLNNKDKITLALSKLDGSKYQEIAIESDRVVGHKVNATGLLNLIYQKDAKVYLIRVDLKEFSVLDNKVIKIQTNER